MRLNRAILTILCGGALVAAHGAEAFAVGGRLVSSDGVPPPAGVYRLDAAFVTNQTAAPLVTASAEVRTDTNGCYVTTLPVSVETLAQAGETLWLRQAFFTKAGASVAELPAQRLGCVPFALHASVADRLNVTNAASVATLSVRSALQAETVHVTNRLLSAGLLVVTNLTAARAANATVRIDRLAVGTRGSALFGRVAGGKASGPRGEALRLEGVAPAGEGLFELTLETENAAGLTAVLRRTAADGTAETLVDLDSPSVAGATRRVLAAPVRTGDVLTVTASCGAAGCVTAAYDFIYFGLSNGVASPEGENE